MPLAQYVKCRGVGGGGSVPKAAEAGDTRMESVFLVRSVPPSPQFRDEPGKKAALRTAQPVGDNRGLAVNI